MGTRADSQVFRSDRPVEHSNQWQAQDNRLIIANMVIPVRKFLVSGKRYKTEAEEKEEGCDNRVSQTGVFDLDIRICNRLFIDVCTSCAAKTGLKSRTVEKGINAV
jgi:hypothetical protein